MVAQLTESKVASSPRIAVTDRGVEVSLLFYVEVDAFCPPQRVLQLAQEGSGATAAIPQKGAPWNNSLNIGGESFTDEDGLEVDAIVGEPRLPGPEGHLKWQFTVTYRTANLRNIARNFENISPLVRPAQFWTESLIVPVARDVARNTQEIKWPWVDTARDGDPPAIRPIGTLGPVTNAAGWRYGSVPTRQEKLPIFVQKLYTTSPFAWIQINNSFKSSKNSIDWNIFGTGTIADAGTCAFFDIDSSRPLYWGTLLYYEIEIRVLHNASGHDIQYRNEGDKYWRRKQKADNTFHWVTEHLFASGQPVQPPVPLDDQGQLKIAAGPDTLVFEDLNEVDYVGLTDANV